MSDLFDLSSLQQQAMGYLEWASEAELEAEVETNMQTTKDTFCDMCHNHGGR
ncbi:hypothetical protein PtrV1_12994 [Pyrenophora tritici-repentis]|uniref:Uncharacterized protein n=1 Tax=Pyrenophora tritici-repentis TaxID=45151 RepID=A0A317B9F9_9PLEO|nr:hypothetical protein PtrV1_12994 [Pyrenophora tritici-repentis]KAI1510865.1 hypothetical protein Ptr86124_009986 [Pyrenophora tritici-repentis]KAI1680867.1 hypothetical protein KJE20_09718 [Pyrenophora tritici-repentis]PWO25601.1 RPB9, DNA-directed RNA polymerase [Pyrenophora tritici-repentis]